MCIVPFFKENIIVNQLAVFILCALFPSWPVDLSTFISVCLINSKSTDLRVRSFRFSLHCTH